MQVLDWYRSLSGSRQIIVAGTSGLAVFLGWASLAQVDEVTRGQGHIIPSSKAQIVQASAPATIRTILVRSGQTVRKGQLLVRLEDTETSSQLGQIEAESRSLQARAARLSSEGGGAQDCPANAGGALSTECDDESALQKVRASGATSRKPRQQSPA
jgi:adhesin transport system membrane fusion protein